MLPVHHGALYAGTSLRFAGGRLRWPTKQITSTAAGNNLAVISEFSWLSPGYPVRDLQFLFPAYWCDISGVSASEKVVGNNITVSFSVRIGAGGSWVQGTIGSASSATLTDGTNNWSDAGLFSPSTYIPAGTQISVRTLISVSDTQIRPGGLRSTTSGANGFIGEFARRDAVVGNLTTFLTGGTITTNVSGVDLDLYGPAAVIGKCAGKPRSILILGDSIDYSRSGTLSDADDASNNQGMWDVPFQALGWGHCNAAFQGVKLQFDMASDATASFVKRPAAFTALPSLPFDTVVAGTLHNDTSATAFATVQGWFNNWCTRVKSFFPNVRLGHGTPLPFTTTSATTLAGQTVATGASSPSGPMFQMRDYIVAGAGGRLNFSVDRSALSAKTFLATDPEDKWRTDQGGTKDLTTYTADGTHPNDAGFTILAAAIQAQAAAGVI